MLERLLAIALLALLSGSPGCSPFDRDDVLVLVHAEDTLSRALGEAYASAHRIPTARILALSLPAGPRRTEVDWPTYRESIAEPIEAYLAREDPGGEIEILVTTRGLPLRLGHCDVDEREQFPRHCRVAALDAALAGLGRFDPSSPGLGQAANPFFRDTRSFSAFRRAEPDAALRFLVARLTGPPAPASSADPTPDWIHRLAEPPPSAEGTAADPPTWRIVTRPGAPLRSAAAAALLDPIAARLAPAGHRICDECEEPETNAGAAGIIYADLESNGNHPPALDRRAIRLGAPGLVIDLTPHLSGNPSGEQAGDWSAGFERAVADWLAAGARAISTHLDDPGLAAVTRPAIQLEAFVAGRPAVEAHFKSVPHLGWLNVFVGDPLLALAEPEDLPDGDRDHDGIPDEQDNCLDHANPAQRDSNQDGIGNRCDPDVDDDGLVATSWGQIYPMDSRGDLESIALTVRSGPHDPSHDLDGDGVVDERDLALAQLWLFRAPGPSGLPESRRRESD